jgi:hypothetical protein
MEHRMRFEYGGLFGLIILIADIWAIVHVVGSHATNGKKVVWIVLIILLPILGFIFWYFAGPRSRKSLSP